jgi:hypothetical protein
MFKTKVDSWFAGMSAVGRYRLANSWLAGGNLKLVAIFALLACFWHTGDPDEYPLVAENSTSLNHVLFLRRRHDVECRAIVDRLWFAVSLTFETGSVPT